jgi:hypothetical protein
MALTPGIHLGPYAITDVTPIMVLGRNVTEHRPRLVIGSTHWRAPFVSWSIVVQRDRYVDPSSLVFQQPAAS